MEVTDLLFRKDQNKNSYLRQFTQPAVFHAPLPSKQTFELNCAVRYQLPVELSEDTCGKKVKQMSGRQSCQKFPGGLSLQAAETLARQGICISRKAFFDLLEECIKKKDIVAGREVNSLIAKSGFEYNSFLGSHLIRMFAACGDLVEADLVFRKLPKPSVYTWNAIILAHANLGESERAIELYKSLIQSGARANEYVYVSVLKACTNIAALSCGNLIYSVIIKDGLESDLFICNTVMDMFAKCGYLKDAHKVFDAMCRKDEVSWNALATGYAQHACSQEAAQLLQQMLCDGVCPDDVTFASVVKACSGIHDLYLGEVVHHCIIECGFNENVHVANILIHMYMACGTIHDANEVFGKLKNPDIVTWSTVISGYAHHGYGHLALETFEWMQGEGLKPNNVVYPSILKACASVCALDEGKLVHFHLTVNDYGFDAYIGSALIDMYAKCGSLDDAFGVFNRFPRRSEVTLNSMICAYAQNEQGQEAFHLFQQLGHLGFDPDRITFLNALKACTVIVALEWGKMVHDQIVRCGFVEELSIGNALIDMYSKCGSLPDAYTVFDFMSARSVVTWSAMLAGYALHNEYDVLLECFEDMQKIGLKPNNVTFLSLLSACGHKGLINKAYGYFYSMKVAYGIKPATEHYNCMVDILGRAGRVDEARYLLLTMPYRNKLLAWKSLLSHCKGYSNVHLGRQCFDHLTAVDPGDASVYALMLDIYADANMWDEVRKIQEMRNNACLWKSRAKAFIPVENSVHEFIDGDQRHPEKNAIYARLKAIDEQMKENKIILHSPPVWKSMSDDDLDDILTAHCELLALVFGLMSTCKATTLRISKNLKLCNDCHIAMKFISKTEKRAIMVMDNHCVHRIKDGLCSCKDLYY